MISKRHHAIERVHNQNHHNRLIRQETAAGGLNGEVGTKHTAGADGSIGGDIMICWETGKCPE